MESYGNGAEVLAAGYIADMGYDQEIGDACNPLLSARKWIPLQANA